MTFIDGVVFVLYFLIILGIGYYFYRRNKGAEDYYIGGRKVNYPHVGLSVVATDVGGGFSIGLGGLGFVMGIAGSWMLFTGLLGAWLAAVFLIPKVKNLSTAEGFYTMPDVFRYFFNGKVAFVAGIISAIGYLGFTSSQMLAGAVLASSTFAELDMNLALWVMGSIIIVYTVMGGIKAVIYTDTFQWILLLGGLIFVGIPIAYHAIGGMEAIRATVEPEMLSLGNLTWVDAVNWGVTIIPIWFVGMTLYQRIYATRSEADAKKAWYMAGVFEWPIMAFMGVSLGLFARVAADQGMFADMGFETSDDMQHEQGLPTLLATVLPIGFMGLMMSAYFSAIMSTADSCLVASSGNVSTDLIGRIMKWGKDKTSSVKVSQLVTLVIGVLALLLAAAFDEVLEIMLYSYAFMVSGLLVPIVGALYWKKSSSAGALAAMIGGGVTTFLLTLFVELDARFDTSLALDLPFGLDPNIFGISLAVILFITISLWKPDRK